MGLTSSVAVAINADLVKVLDLATGRVPLAKTYTKSLVHGTAAGQADLVFHDTRTVAASTNEDLDLAGVLLDPMGTTLTFLRVKALLIAAADSNVNNVVVGAAAANPWVGILGATHTITIRPGGLFVYAAGQADATGAAVVAATGDLLRVANSGAGTGVTYDIIVIGASA